MISENRNILNEWIAWHFIEAPKFLIGVWKNYIMFSLNFFSVPVLLKSFFSPWRKYRWNYPKSFDIQEFFNTLISNIFSRFLGALMRTILIIAGIILQIFVVFAGLFLILLWIFFPFVILAIFLFALFY